MSLGACGIDENDSMAGFAAEYGVGSPNLTCSFHLKVGFGNCRGMVGVAGSKSLDVEVREVAGGEIRVGGKFLMKPPGQSQAVLKDALKALTTQVAKNHPDF